MTKPKKITTTSGTYMLCKSILGASITNVPGVFTELGLVLGVIVFALMTFITIHSLLFITVVARRTKAKNLVEIGEKVDKRKGKIFVTVTLFLMCLVPLIFYILKSNLYIKSFLEFCDINVNEKVVHLGVVLVCMVMSICFKKADKLKYVSIIGLVSLSFMTLYTIYLFFMNYKNIDFTGQKLFKFDMQSIKKISVVCFAFCCHFGILSITDNLDTQKECRTVIVSSCSISLMVYLVTGICGHFAQITYDTDDFFQSIKKNMFTEILKLTLAIVNISTFPLIMLATREAFDFFVTGNKKVKNHAAIKNYEVIFLVSLCYAISIPFQKYLSLLDAMFFFTGSIVMFALPSYFYYRVMKNELTMFAYFMLFANAALTLFGFCAGVYILCP